MNEKDLLRKYEPIAYFTKGEVFFPIGVEGYVKECSLWLTDPEGRDQLLVPYGELTLEKLVEYDEIPEDHKMHLRLVEEPLEGLAYQRWLRDPDKEKFIASGRLARVPLAFRLFDSIFDISLLIRGQVPGGQAAAADIKNRTITDRDSRRVYFGRVIHQGGWIALQYLFFYSMNNWRSGFFGVNDHEADWEQVLIFLTDPEEAEPQPRWVAYASHDFKGDDLRRRWDDPHLAREGDHPVVFVGAGSHANYFEQGEYVMGTEPGFLQPAKGVLEWMRKFWNDTLGMGSGFRQTSNRAMLSVPFIDYARGDGKSIGPDQEEGWDPIVISDDVPWVHKYRGLWGLDTHDPIGGERAPAGPKYNRDGSVRQSWYDPVGWAGLDKLFPLDKVGAELEDRLSTLGVELTDLERLIEARREALRVLALDAEALKVTEYFNVLRIKKEGEIKQAQEDLQDLQGRHAELVETKLALEAYTRRLEGGDRGSPTAHLHHVHRPEPPLPQQHRLVEVWAAVSGAIIVLASVVLLIVRPGNWLAWLLGLAIVLAAVEALTRGRFVDYMLNIIIILAVIAALILIYEFWIWILALGLAVVALFMIRGNLQELRR